MYDGVSVSKGYDELIQDIFVFGMDENFADWGLPYLELKVESLSHFASLFGFL